MQAIQESDVDTQLELELVVLIRDLQEKLEKLKSIANPEDAEAMSRIAKNIFRIMLTNLEAFSSSIIMSISENPGERGNFEEALCGMNRRSFEKFYSWMCEQVDVESRLCECVAGASLKIYYDELEGLGKYPDGREIIQVLVDNEFLSDSDWYRVALSEFFYEALEKGRVDLAFESSNFSAFPVRLDDFLSVESMLLYFKTEAEYSSIRTYFTDVLKMSNLEYMKVLIKKTLSGKIVLNELEGEGDKHDPLQVAKNMTFVTFYEETQEQTQKLLGEVINEFFNENERKEILLSMMETAATRGVLFSLLH